MKYAWIENDRVRDVCHGNPQDCYHADIAKFYNTQVPDEAVNGQGWDGSNLIPIPVPVITEPVIEPTKVSLDTIRENLTLSEKAKWDNNLIPEIITAKLEFAHPLLVEDATPVLAFLVAAGAISQSSVDKILA
jgi:hypothetical protein